MTTTHTDVLPFLAATEAAVLTPCRLPDYLDRFDDATLDAVHAFGDLLARTAAAVQGHRRFQRLWEKTAAPPVLGAEEAAAYTAAFTTAMAALPNGDLVPAGRHAVPAPDPVPPGERADERVDEAAEEIDPADTATAARRRQRPRRRQRRRSDAGAGAPDPVPAVEWPQDPTESETA
jgi:hypothetical protein